MSVRLFYAYAKADRRLRNALEPHLSLLQREGLIEQWHDRMITAGQEWRGQIDEHLDDADLILLLVSADFLASDYCYDVEMTRGMERHRLGEAVVVPIILRPVDWKTAPFSVLQALPTDAKPITKWSNRDEAFLDVAKGIRRRIAELSAGKSPATVTSPLKATDSPSAEAEPLGFLDHMAEIERAGEDAIAVLNEISELTVLVSKKTEARTEQVSELTARGKPSGIEFLRVAAGMAEDLRGFASALNERLPRYVEHWGRMRSGIAGMVARYGDRFGPTRDDLEKVRVGDTDLRAHIASAEKSVRGLRQTLDNNRGIARVLNEAIRAASAALERLASEYAASQQDVVDLDAQISSALEKPAAKSSTATQPGS